MAQTWPAADDVIELMEFIRHKHHHRLEQAKIAVAFVDAKPFVKGRFNWGKAKKFTTQAKLWHAKDKKYDFEITLPADGWYQVLQGVQKEAWIDLHLCRFRPEMMPVTAEVNGKVKPVKDEFGRIQYTDQVKIDDKTGEPIWCVDPLDLHVLTENASHYGLWCEDLQDFGAAILESQAQQGEGKIVANAEVAFKSNPVPDENHVPYEYAKKVGQGMD